METLLYERNSAFDHGIWSRYEYLKLMAISYRLQNAHEKGYASMGYSLVQDAYYALTDNTPNASPVGKKWAEVIAQDYFPQLQAEMTDTDRKINTTLLLAEKFENHYLQKDKQNPPPEDQPQPNKDQGGASMPQEIQDALSDLAQEQADDEGDTEADEQAGPQFGAKVVNKSIPMMISAEEIEELREENEGTEILSGLMAGTGAGPRETRQFVEHQFNPGAVKSVANIVGWGRKVMEGAARKNQGAMGEMTGYKMDTWSHNVHPLDRSQVIEGSMVGLAKLADSQLNTRIYDEEKPMGQGAMVILRDESSSMEDFGKHEKAINLQLALASICHEQNRPVIDIAWDDDSTRSYEYGNPGLQDHLNTFLGGGTRIQHVLTKAFDHIDENPAYRDQADIFVISDGEIGDADIDDTELLDRITDYKKRGGRIWFVWIDYHGITRSKTQIEKWADLVLSVDDFYNSEGMEKVLANIATNRNNYESTFVK